MEPGARIEFRGRLVAPHYPERHANAQQISFYDNFSDGVPRNRVPYGTAKDRYPGGITHMTREERSASRIKSRLEALESLLVKVKEGRITKKSYHEEIARINHCFPRMLPLDEEIRTDRRCPDCDCDVGEFHLLGCDVEVCPRCNGQAISCDCAEKEDNENKTARS
jgi:hypothetical protein